MLFEPQEDKLSVVSVDLPLSSTVQLRHGPLLPNNIRCIICGPSNCGKTNVMYNLLTNENGLKFENVYLYTKSPDQVKYKLLRTIIDDVQGANMYVYTDNDQVEPPEKSKPNSIYVFDDVICEKQKNITSYFCRGRHNGVDVFYLTQTYSRVPKQLVRDNANMIILYKQDETNLKHVYDDHCSSDMTFVNFKEMCGKCWNSDRYEFLLISKECALNDGRYRKGFDVYIKKQE